MSKKHKKSKAKQSVKKVKAVKPSFTLSKSDWIAIGLCLLISSFVFQNTLDNAFVNWDDNKNFYENEHITTLNDENFWSNTKDIFASNVIGNYNPLTIWTFLLDAKIYGVDNPMGWHLNNVLLHLVGVFFVFLIGRRLKLNVMSAAFLALLFGVHPLRSESVAWVTERKDVLFGAFYLAAIYQYLRYKLDGKKKAVTWIFLFFILSLLSKIQAVALPLTLIAIDYYLDQKISLKSIISKWPYFLLSLMVGLIGIYFLGEQGSLDATSSTYPVWQRLFVGSYSYCVYIVKTIIPYRMSPLYPYPPEIPIEFYLSMLVLPVFIGGMYYAYKKQLYVWVFGFAVFTFNIVFLLQVLGAGQGFLADRFTYIAHLGLYFIMAYYLEKASQHPKWKTPSLILAGTLIVAFSFMTFQQNQIWKNSGTLWTHVLKYYKKAKLPYGNRANYYRDNGQLKEAMSDYNDAIRLGEASGKTASLAQTYNSRARLYFDGSNNRDTLILALQDYTKAIELKPGDGEFHTNRGATFARLGDIDNALKDITKGIEFKPNHAVAYLNRSLMYGAKGRPDLAKKDLDTYLQLNPYNSDMWYEKARLQQQIGDLNGAIASFTRAIELNASKGVYFYGRSKAYLASNNRAKAIEDFNTATGLGFTQIEAVYRQQLGI